MGQSTLSLFPLFGLMLNGPKTRLTTLNYPSHYIYKCVCVCVCVYSYQMSFKLSGKKKPIFFSWSGKKKCIKLRRRRKKKKDIERNITKFYQLGRRKQCCFIYQFFVRMNKKEYCVSSLICVTYIYIYRQIDRQIGIYKICCNIYTKWCLLKGHNSSNQIYQKVHIEML